MAKISPFEFMRQVRQEVNKVTWPSRKETMTTTILVFLMVFICAVFFLIVDRILAFGVAYILGMGA
jgi:preprotein translocase subunit SecE